MGQALRADTRTERVGERIARGLARRGISPAALWRDFGISPRLIELYEAGTCLIPPGHLEAIARAIGVSPAELAEDAGQLLDKRQPSEAAQPENRR